MQEDLLVAKMAADFFCVCMAGYGLHRTVPKRASARGHAGVTTTEMNL